MLKRIGVIFLLFLVSCGGFAKDITFFSGPYHCELDDFRIKIRRYNGDDTALTIPAKIEGKKVTQIDERAFDGNSKLTSVTIPYGVREIEDFAFRNCTNLRTIIIPSSVKEIDERAFDGCTNLTIKCEKGSYAERWVNYYGSYLGISCDPTL